MNAKPQTCFGDCTGCGRRCQDQAADALLARAESAEAELAAWRETFEEQTTGGRSHRSYAECYAIGTRKLVPTSPLNPSEPK